MAQVYRQAQIDNLLKQLSDAREEALSQLHKHKCKEGGLEKAGYILSSIIMVSGISGVSVLSTVVSAPVGITLGVIAGVCGVAQVVTNVIHKKSIIKTQKWYALFDLISENASQISQLVSEILDDDNITAEELSRITASFDSYRTRLTELRNEYMAREKSIPKLKT